MTDELCLLTVSLLEVRAGTTQTDRYSCTALHGWLDGLHSVKANVQTTWRWGISSWIHFFLLKGLIQNWWKSVTDEFQYFWIWYQDLESAGCLSLSLVLRKECRLHCKWLISAKAFTLGAVCLHSHSLVCLNYCYTFPHVLICLLFHRWNIIFPLRIAICRESFLTVYSSSISSSTTLTYHDGPRPEPHIREVN